MISENDVDITELDVEYLSSGVNVSEKNFLGSTILISKDDQGRNVLPFKISNAVLKEE